MFQHQVFVCDEGNDLADATAYVTVSKAEMIRIYQLKMVNWFNLISFHLDYWENTSIFLVD